MKCPWCGADNPAGAETCANCGTILISSPERHPRYSHRQDQTVHPTNEPDFHRPRPDRGRSKRILPVLVALAVIVVAMLVTFEVLQPQTQSEFLGTTPAQVGPEGSWGTEVPADFTIRANSGTTGILENTGIESRSVVLTITKISGLSLVEVSMSYYAVSTHLWNDTPYVQEPSPDVFTGTMDGNTLTIDRNAVTASITVSETQMVGSWNYHYQNGTYIQDVSVSGLALMKR